MNVYAIFSVAEKSQPPAKVPDELMPANLVELETSVGETAAKAIAAYQKAASAIQDYNREVIKVVESVNATVGSSVWNRYFFITYLYYTLQFLFFFLIFLQFKNFCLLILD